MNASPVLLARCENCHARFLPRPGACPRCGSDRVRPHPVPGIGRVRAATEIAGTDADAVCRLALVELPEGVLALAVLTGELVASGTEVRVERDADVYRARPVGA